MPWTVETQLRGRRAEQFLAWTPGAEIRWQRVHRWDDEAPARQEYERWTGYDCAVRLLDPAGVERVWCNPPYSDIGPWVESDAAMRVLGQPRPRLLRLPVPR